MPNPFPGMNPYLESARFWRDLHHSLITYIREQLQPHLRPKYIARVEESLSVMPSENLIYPDVHIFRQTLHEAVATQAVEHEQTRPDKPIARPWIVTVSDAPPPETYIEIISVSTREVITSIEVLSPTNKAKGDGLDAYARKRRNVLSSQTNLVEIDLLRDGIRPMPQPTECDASRCRYMLSVSRATKREQYELYPVALNESLPRFNIPLREPDPDVPLDLQAAFDRCYESGAYEDLLDYSQPPGVVLTELERGWLSQSLGK